MYPKASRPDIILCACGCERLEAIGLAMAGFLKVDQIMESLSPEAFFF
jgi:hypothetical protein